MKENKISGVYKITNKITGESYIGSSENIKYRWATHKCLSIWKRYPKSRLYKDMVQYGLNNFIFEVLEETTDLHNREQYWIEHFKPAYNDRYADGYNIERYKEAHERYSKEWHKSHRNEKLTKTKAYFSRLCLYEGKTLTFGALSRRFSYQGIANPCKEAKKYLL